MDRLSPLDASFLHLEHGNAHLHIGSALIFEGPAPALRELRAAFEALLDRVPRYRQRVQQVPLQLGRPVWVDDVGFDIRRHLRRTRLPPPGTDDALKWLASRLMSRPLDLTRPPWETWFVEGLAGGRWALINKAHHAMVDGISGADITSLLLSPEPDVDSPAPRAWSPTSQPSSAELVGAALADTVRTSLVMGRAVVNAVRSPARALRRTAATLYGLVHAGAKAVHFENVLNGPIGAGRRWEWATTDLADIKMVKNAVGGTVNDVVVAAVAGGFRRYLISRGEPVDGRSIRALVPVSTRAPDQRGQPGNELSALLADLPVGIADPRERLATVTRDLHNLKSGGMAIAVEGLLDAAEVLPGTIFAVAADLAARVPQRSFSTVTTNVPGPQLPMYLLARKVTGAFPFIPLGADLRITIGIVSYDGKVNYGITADRDAAADVHVLRRGIEESTAEMVRLVA
ncbi:MAG TPA: wax ester/triacylglycerol synthase family O-acyltransferase [Jiangellaceae bacterium]